MGGINSWTELYGGRPLFGREKCVVVSFWAKCVCVCVLMVGWVSVLSIVFVLRNKLEKLFDPEVEWAWNDNCWSKVLDPIIIDK